MNTRPANMTAATSLADIQNGCRFEWGERDDFIVLAPANQSALLAVLAERPDAHQEPVGSSPAMGGLNSRSVGRGARRRAVSAALQD